MTPFRARRDRRAGAGGHQATRSGPGALTAVLGLCVVVPLAMLLVGAWLAGWRLQHVTTYSMEPQFPAGSLLVSTPIDPAEVEVGMVITFVDPRDRGRTVTHRVIEVQTDADDGLQFVTQGDANDQSDTKPVPARNVRSQVKWAVPNLGRLLAAAQGRVGVAVLLGIPLLVLIGGELRDRRTGGIRAGRFDGVCNACAAAIFAEDRYCRRCGARQPTHPPEEICVVDRPDPRASTVFGAGGAPATGGGRPLVSVGRGRSRHHRPRS